MTRHPKLILGINPGTRYVGLSCFVGNDLRDWRLKVIRGKWSSAKRKKLDAALYDYIDRFKPIAIALKKLDPARSSPQLRAFAASLRSFARRKHISVHEYTIKEIESLVLGEERKNRHRLADAIAQEYPILLSELNRELSHKNAYHLRMFEAVALASVCARSLE